MASPTSSVRSLGTSQVTSPTRSATSASRSSALANSSSAAPATAAGAFKAQLAFQQGAPIKGHTSFPHTFTMIHLPLAQTSPKGAAAASTTAHPVGLALGGNNGVITIYQQGSEKPFCTLMGHAQDKIYGIYQDPITGNLASVSEDGCVKIWDLQTQQCLLNFNKTGRNNRHEYAAMDQQGFLIDWSRSDVCKIDLSVVTADKIEELKRQSIASGSSSNTSLEQAAPFIMSVPTESFRLNSYVHRIAVLLPNGVLAEGGYSGLTLINTKSPATSIKIDKDHVKRALVLPNNKLLSYSEGKTFGLKIWVIEIDENGSPSVKGGTPEKTIETGYIKQMALRPDGKLLIRSVSSQYASLGEIFSVWNLETGVKEEEMQSDKNRTLIMEKNLGLLLQATRAEDGTVTLERYNNSNQVHVIEPSVH